jgi:RNA polymerase sigma-70 factor (ECF subfamily)
MYGQVTSSELFASDVDGIRRLDPDAWEALYKRLYAGLFGYAARRLGAERAADAVAEAMARAVAGIGRFEWKGAGLDAWIYGILRNVVADAQRSRAREARRRVPTSPMGHDPLDHVVETEEAVRVRRAFADLPSADREVLELRVIGGLDANEIAAVLGKRPGAVRMAQSRALARLRRALELGEQR